MDIKGIGMGYYGIEAEGVSVDQDVSARIDKAFQSAASVPAKKLRIRTASATQTKAGRDRKAAK